MSAPDPAAVLAALAAPGGQVGPLWVVTRGRGRPLVLLHGNGEDHHVFDRLVPLLGPGRTLVGVDSRGHGRSPRGDGPLTVASMADDVAAVLDALGLRGSTCSASATAATSRSSSCCGVRSWSGGSSWSAPTCSPRA